MSISMVKIVIKNMLYASFLKKNLKEYIFLKNAMHSIFF